MKRIGFVLSAALLGVLTGCVHHDHPRQARVHAEPPAVRVEAHVDAHPEYVYYPNYQVYYSSHRNHYVYLEGRSWVTRLAPPRVSVSVLFASPSVRLDFRDDPAAHHTTVVRQYPRHWSPPGADHGRKVGHDQGGKKPKKGHK